MKPQIREFFQKHKGLFLIVVPVAAAAVFYVCLVPKSRPNVYQESYRLVPEKISKSASVPVFLPPQTDKAWAEKNISFSPEIKGKWLSQESQSKPTLLASLWPFLIQQKENFVYFKPDSELSLERHYQVNLTLADGSQMKQDFLAVEDPSLLAVFPAKGTETAEDSEVTIVFNRPMVALTALGYLEGKGVPVEITPQTAGRFKWITTRNLQFIPQDRLKRSSNYQVRIKPGLVSIEGLEIKPFSSEFVTRQLRYADAWQDQQIAYNQALAIHFNQPVDLEKTRKEITITDQSTGRIVAFNAQYENGNKTDTFFKNWRNFLLHPFSGPKASSNNADINQSTILISGGKDRFGREGFWDFEHNYSLKINRAYPLEGDISLEESRETYFNVPSVIQSITASSERTNWASPDFFDPQGKLEVSFYEEIRLEESVITSRMFDISGVPPAISSPQLERIVYGEKCQDEQESVYNPKDCKKTTDRKTILVSFRAEQVKPDQTITLSFEKIVNSQGIAVNKEPIEQALYIYPSFSVFQTGETGSKLNSLVICSNTPLSVPESKDYKQHITANLDYEIRSWYPSYRIVSQYEYELCQVGEFHTTIDYGLKPESNYQLTLRLEDVFGQKTEFSFGFATGPMPSEQLSFYHLQNGYNVTSGSKTTLSYAVQNMTYVNLDLCRLSAQDFLYYLKKQPSLFDSPNAVAGCLERKNATIKLPEKFWSKNYFRVNVKDYFPQDLGFYVLTFSHPNYKTSYWDWEKTQTEIEKPVYERTFLNITNLAVAEKRIQPETAFYGGNQALSEKQRQGLRNLYWVTDLAKNLEPVSGALVKLYQGENLKPADSSLTGPDGIALTKSIADLWGVVVSQGEDKTVIPAEQDQLNWADFASQAKKIYLYTDKPIYRPDQTVFFKGIMRLGYDGSYEIYRDKKLKLKVSNSRGEEILSQDLNVSEFGTVNTQFLLDKNSPLGSYSLCVDDYNCTWIDVQEYQPSAFEVKITGDKEEYISRDAAELNLEASYYFGVPLESGQAEYTFSSQNYYFDSQNMRFGPEMDYSQPYDYGDKFLFRGKTDLVQGKAKISRLLDMAQLFPGQKPQSRIIVFDITVTNPQGQSVSQQKSFLLHAGDFYLGLAPDKYFAAKNEEIQLKIKSLDIKGNPWRKAGLEFSLYKTDWVYAKRQEAGGGYAYQWEKRRELVSKESLSTDSEGSYTKNLKISQEGEYEAELMGRDSRDNQVLSSLSLYVWGEGQVSVRPTRGTELEMKAEKTDLKVGEEASVIIKSPYAKAKALICLERGRILNCQVKEISGNIYKFSFKAEPEQTPNIFLTVLLQSETQDVKFGQTEFRIDSQAKKLFVEVKPNKTFYLPGEEVLLDISTRDSGGNPESSELSVSVVDLSVLALKGNPKKNPLVFFYGGFPLTVSASSNLKNILVETEIPKTKGGGGREAAQDSSLAKKARGEFKETAFWQAVVITDQEGKASLKFTLPDNLTRWQAETIGVSQDTKLGVDYEEFTTKKELMVVPLKPRFVVPGDEFYIGAKIFNQSPTNQKLEVSLESPSLTLEEKGNQSLRVDKNETQTVYFKVQAPQSVERGEHGFVLSAKNESLEDTVVQYIKITPNDTYESAATANYVSEQSVKEYVFLPNDIVKGKGELNIKSSATLAVFLSEALNYLIDYPLGCSEQISARLNAIAIVKKGLNVPNLSDKLKLEKIKYEGKEYSLDELVSIGLAQLYGHQREDGGFSFWPGLESNAYATLSVLEALQNLSLAGYQINQNSLKRAADWLYNETLQNEYFYRHQDNVILAAYTLSALPDWPDRLALKQKLIETASGLSLMEDISHTSLAELAIMAAKPESGFSASLKKKVFDSLDNRLSIDSRGAFLEPNQNFLWYYYETPVKDTALYLKALASRQSSSPVLDKVLRWLLNSREKDGAWGSTSNTLAAVDALTNFLSWKKETESDFSLDFQLNGKALDSFRFEPKTILEQFKKLLSLDSLKLNENNVVAFSKTDNNQQANSFYYDLSLKYYLPANKVGPRDEGFSLVKNFYRLTDVKNEKPVTEATVGDVLRVHLQLTAPQSRHFVALEDRLPAGFEIVNLDLATEQKSLRLQDKEFLGRELPVSFKELKDDRAFFFAENLVPGVYEYDYYIRALTKGSFTLLPSVAYEMYFPENFGRTAAGLFTVR